MKIIFIILSLLISYSCSTNKCQSTNVSSYDRYFSLQSLLDMKVNENLGSEVEPFNIEVINKIRKNENGEVSLNNAYPEGYWVYDNGKIFKVIK